MNKKIIATAVAAAFALPVITAHAADFDTKGPTVYGKLHLNLSKYDNDGSAGDNYKLNSFDSRLGVKGQVNLTEGLAGTYQVESGITADAKGAAGTALGTRTTYAGLKGGFGEVRFGYHDSPLKMAQGKFDQFGDTDGDFKHAGSQQAENRNANSITYLGKFGNLGFNAQLAPGEGNGTSAGQNLTDNTSIAVTYTAGPLYLAAATDSYDKKTVATSAANTMNRLVGIYTMNSMQIGVLYQSGVQSAVTSSNSKEDWLGVSFGMKLGGGNKLKAQYITTKDHATTKEEGKQTTVGFDHALGKKGTLYAMYNKTDMTTAAKDKSSVSIGYVLKF